MQFNAAPRPYRLGNDQLRRYNRVRAGQRTQGRVNIAIDVVTILLIVSVSAIVAVVELSSMPDTMLETLAALALALILGGGLILLALLAALLIVARRWHREWDGNEDLVIFSESHAALRSLAGAHAVVAAQLVIPQAVGPGRGIELQRLIGHALTIALSVNFSRLTKQLQAAQLDTFSLVRI